MAERRVSILAILPTQIVTMLLGLLAMLIDSIMINRFLGDTAQAAYGLTAPVTLLVTAFGGMVASGAHVLVGRCAGHGNADKEIGRILSTTIITAVAGALVVAIPNIIFSKQCSYLLGAVNEEMAEMTASYLRVVVLSYPVMVLAFVLPAFLQFCGRKIDIVISAIILIVLDTLFNYISVVWLNGGMQGMATASVLSYYCSFIYLVYALYRQPQLRVSLRAFTPKMAVSALKYGLVYLVYKLCSALLSFVINRMLAANGSVDYLAANSILSSVMLVTSAFSSGIGSTTTMICSYHIGRGDAAALRGFLKKIFAVSFCVNIVLTLLCIFGARGIVNVFRPQSDILFSCAVAAIQMYAGALVFHSINHIYRNYNLSLDRKDIAYLLCSLDNLIMPLIAAIAIQQIVGIEYIWLCYPIGQALAALIAFLINRRSEKHRQAEKVNKA